MDVMVTEDVGVTDIVDWQLSPLPQPSGMGLHRIHDFAGTFNEQVYSHRREYYEMEEVFWQEVLSALSARDRQIISQHLQAVQLAITIGTILWAFDFGAGAEFINPAVLVALPKSLSHRIPALRGNEPAYHDTLANMCSNNTQKTKTQSYE